MFKIDNLFLAVIVALAAALPGAAQRLKADEIIAKHLDSIGKAEKRAELTTLMALGYSEFEARNPQVKGGGKAVVVSDPGNLFFVISLNSREYPYERIGYFNGKPNLPFIASGSRSALGYFVSEHQKILSDGLFGGSMTLRWNSVMSGPNRSRLRADGTKKVDGVNAYVLEYQSPEGSGDFKIRLYFDVATFRHIRTEYRREVSVGQVVFGAQNQQANAVATLTEEFSDFKDAGGFTLPFAYKVSYVSNSSSMSNENVWKINVAQYSLNQKLQPGFFSFDAS